MNCTPNLFGIHTQLSRAYFLAAHKRYFIRDRYCRRCIAFPEIFVCNLVLLNQQMSRTCDYIKDTDLYSRHKSKLRIPCTFNSGIIYQVYSGNVYICKSDTQISRTYAYVTSCRKHFKQCKFTA